jgi:hypothetical protein
MGSHLKNAVRGGIDDGRAGLHMRFPQFSHDLRPRGGTVAQPFGLAPGFFQPFRKQRVWEMFERGEGRLHDQPRQLPMAAGGILCAGYRGHSPIGGGWG